MGKTKEYYWDLADQDLNDIAVAYKNEQITHEQAKEKILNNPGIRMFSDLDVHEVDDWLHYIKGNQNEQSPIQHV